MATQAQTTQPTSTPLARPPRKRNRSGKGLTAQSGNGTGTGTSTGTGTMSKATENGLVHQLAFSLTSLQQSLTRTFQVSDAVHAPGRDPQPPPVKPTTLAGLIDWCHLLSIDFERETLGQIETLGVMKGNRKNAANGSKPPDAARPAPLMAGSTRRGA